MHKKEVIRKRHSNRVYPPKFCSKPDCSEEFVPTDSRQIYCSKQHQIDANNDRRKIVDSYESDFNKGAKNNRKISIKVYNSPEYKSRGFIHYSILKYEGYDFDIFHSIKKDAASGVEVKFCFEYGLLLTNPEKQMFKIVKIESHEI